MSPLFIGTAGWSVPTAFKDLFPLAGTHLERYSQILNCAEINTSFYRDHKSVTYARWAESVPKDFKFSVKLSKVFTHDTKLQLRGRSLATTLDGVSYLGEKLGVLLVQLPASLIYEKRDAIPFFSDLRKYYEGFIALEPRHKSWLNADVQMFMRALKISRVIADPNPFNVENTVEDVDDQALIYFRWHGSPQMYRSNYSEVSLRELQGRLSRCLNFHRPVWCIFDNTTYGFATHNAVQLQQFMRPSPEAPSAFF